jgi:hypothetical protein
MYAVLRRNLFKVLARGWRRSKLAGAVRRHALCVDPQSIVESDVALIEEFEKQWERDDPAL